MASKDKGGDNGKSKTAKTEAKALLSEARARYKQCVEFEHENRRDYRDDMKFVHVPGEQWDELTRKERGTDRPMFEFNHTRVTVKNVINEMRSNRPTVKFHPTEDADKPIAEAREGIARNIWNQSDGDSVIDYAAEHQCGGGFGAWRIDTKYASEDSFDQDVMISAMQNPLCVYADFACQDPLKRDARFWFVHSRMAKDEYESKYKGKEIAEFEPEEIMELDEVDDDDRVWVAEYWKKVPTERHLCLYSDGSVIDKMAEPKYAAPEGVTLVQERKFMGTKIVQYILSGDAILEGPNDWAGSEFPFVIVYGDYTMVDGKVYWCGVGRYMKDSQRAHNWAMTSVIESIASAPTAKIWATPKQAEGLAGSWNTANKKNLPFQLYNPDPAVPGPPPRVGSADVPAALMQVSAMTTDEMKASSGIFDASVGAQGNETSGRAIANRAAQGRIATFNFPDNMLKAVKRTYEILNDLIPKIYDTRRTFRILGADGAEKYIQVNGIDAAGNLVNDLGRGKYDIVLTAGPNFATQRLEAAETYSQLAQGNPQVMAAAGDLIFKSMDLPFSEQIAERIRAILPPPIQQMLNKDKPIPAEVQAAMMQVDQAMQQVQQQGALVQQAQQEAVADKATADKAKADVQIAVANLKVQEANLATDVANFKTLVAQTQAQMAEKQATTDGENERESLTAQLQQALGQIQQEASAMLVQMAQTMAQIQASSAPQVIVPPRPKIKQIVRANGGFVPVYEDQQEVQ